MTQKIANRPPHNAPFGNVENGVVRMIQIWISFFDELFSKLNTLLGDSIGTPSYNVADLPDATINLDGQVIVKDEVGGRTIATSDGTNWRRVSDGAIVS